jgi:E3 ubiquitin-protein ligase HECTD1
MNKRQEEFLDHFARLGVFSKVQSLMGSNGESDSGDVIKSQDEPTSSKACKGEAQHLNLIARYGSNDWCFAPQMQPHRRTIRKKTRRKFSQGKVTILILRTHLQATNFLLNLFKLIHVSNVAYFWHDWSICRGRDCLYVWSDSAALELSNGSNGWFRFILDGKLATMYSSGSPENGNDSSGMHIID